MNLTPFGFISDVCNDKRMSLLNSNGLADLSIGKYMGNRWLSMTNFKNLLVAEVINDYDSTDDKELFYVIASSLSSKCGKYKYLKKKSEKRVEKGERDWGDEISNRERSMYLETLEFLEDRISKYDEKEEHA